MNWLHLHGDEVKEAAKPVALFFNLQLGAFSPVFKWVGGNIEWIVALLSFSFAAWRWWVYRESILHERLRAYILDSDARLAPAYKDVVQLITRPDRRRNLRQPAYGSELAKVLKRHNWEPVLRADGGNFLVERQLTRAVRTIDHRLEIAQKSLTSLRQQRAAAETITAAISAGRATRSRDSKKAIKYDRSALDSYRRVLQLPGHQTDVIAKEGEAYHLLRLGSLVEANAAYIQLDLNADIIPDERQRAFVKSRALRARALILQAEASGGALTGWGLMTAGDPPGALPLREPYLPMSDWDAIEHAELCYATSYLAHRLGFNIQRKSHLELALSNYQRVIDANNSALAIMSSAKRRLLRTAREGIERAKRAPDNFDLEFLFQPQHKTQATAGQVSGNPPTPRTTNSASTPSASQPSDSQTETITRA